MVTISQTMKLLVAVGLLLVNSCVFAIPTLGFGGNVQYDTTGFFPADLNITGNLNGSTDLSLTPDLATSSFSLFADFLSETFGSSVTTGTFGTTPILPDLLVTDNGGSGGAFRTLLTGNVDSMEMVGPNGYNVGSLSGSIVLDGGLLAAEFGGVGTLLSFTFNLTTVFGENMFANSFSGITNGAIIGSVPVPVPLALLSIGLIGITLTRRIHKRG